MNKRWNHTTELQLLMNITNDSSHLNFSTAIHMCTKQLALLIRILDITWNSWSQVNFFQHQLKIILTLAQNLAWNFSQSQGEIRMSDRNFVANCLPSYYLVNFSCLKFYVILLQYQIWHWCLVWLVFYNGCQPSSEFCGATLLCLKVCFLYIFCFEIVSFTVDCYKLSEEVLAFFPLPSVFGALVFYSFFSVVVAVVVVPNPSFLN